MSSTARTKRAPAEDYLGWDAEQPTKNEYVAGEVFGDRIELPSIGATMVVDTLPEGVELPPLAPSRQGTRDPEDD